MSLSINEDEERLVFRPHRILSGTQREELHENSLKSNNNLTYIRCYHWLLHSLDQLPGALALESLWPCSLFVSPGKHRLPDQRSHKEEHGRAIPNLLWPSPGESTQPHGERLLPQVPEVQNVLRFAVPKPEEAQLDLRWGLSEIISFSLPLLPRPSSNVKCHRCSKAVAFRLGGWGWGGDKGPFQSVIQPPELGRYSTYPRLCFISGSTLLLSPFLGLATCPP